MYLFPISFITAFLLTVFTTPIAKNLAFRINAVDHPNDRKIHNDVVPRFGGVAIYLGFIVTLILGFVLAMLNDFAFELRPILGIILGSSIIFILGVFDDINPLSAKVKFFWQIAAALLVYSFGVEISYISNPFNGLFLLPIYMSLPLTVFWIVGITNAINLIDGLDGLAAGVTAISAGTFFVVALSTGSYAAALIMLVLSASSLGFLRYNFFPAKIFLGDSGALTLGFVLATASIIGVFKTTLVVALIIPLLILGVPIFDTLFAIGRRVKDKKSPFKADNKHIHHILLRAGFSQREAVLSIYMVCFLLSFIAIIMAVYR